MGKVPQIERNIGQGKRPGGPDGVREQEGGGGEERRRG